MYYARIILNSSHTLYIQSCDSVPLQKHFGNKFRYSEISNISNEIFKLKELFNGKTIKIKANLQSQLSILYKNAQIKFNLWRKWKNIFRVELSCNLLTNLLKIRRNSLSKNLKASVPFVMVTIINISKIDNKNAQFMHITKSSFF